MIYEFRTYDLFPHNLPKYQEILTNSLAGGRLDHSDLFGYFYSEFGPSTGHSTFGHTKAWTNASPFATKPPASPVGHRPQAIYSLTNQPKSTSRPRSTTPR